MIPMDLWIILLKKRLEFFFGTEIFFLVSLSTVSSRIADLEVNKMTKGIHGSESLLALQPIGVFFGSSSNSTLLAEKPTGNRDAICRYYLTQNVGARWIVGRTAIAAADTGTRTTYSLYGSDPILHTHTYGAGGLKEASSSSASRSSNRPRKALV